MCCWQNLCARKSSILNASPGVSATQSPQIVIDHTHRNRAKVAVDHDLRAIVFPLGHPDFGFERGVGCTKNAVFFASSLRLATVLRFLGWRVGLSGQEFSACVDDAVFDVALNRGYEGGFVAGFERAQNLFVPIFAVGNMQIFDHLSLERAEPEPDAFNRGQRDLVRVGLVELAVKSLIQQGQLIHVMRGQVTVHLGVDLGQFGDDNVRDMRQGLGGGVGLQGYAQGCEFLEPGGLHRRDHHASVAQNRHGHIRVEAAQGFAHRGGAKAKTICQAAHREQGARTQRAQHDRVFQP